ncbi:MAG TPA: SDR family oxidoreductase [Candidatus Competibacter sp.]|nr:SDR family oxidoreductase [Candidatus Competibacteraceae bacterium]HPE72422.1 SDR family oxidoreductase [Candidatus Competibacter sp.]HRW66180.1 SDR family oxidoreductase [Candidatus Competibacter sp.]
MRKVLIVGASSAIAEAVARLFAAQGDMLYLAGRRAEALEAIAADLRVRGAARAQTEVMDANTIERHAALLDNADAALGGLDTVLIAHGTLSDQAVCQKSVALTFQELHTNALSVIALLTLVATRFEAQRSGMIAVISSVAGDRGRQSNYVYGTAKAAVSTFLSGLRQRLHKSSVHVVTIKPGFVDTPMTRGFPKGLLWAQPERVARDIVTAMEKGKDVVYTPGFWRVIIWIIESLPEKIFKSLSF